MKIETKITGCAHKSIDLLYSDFIRHMFSKKELEIDSYEGLITSCVFPISHFERNVGKKIKSFYKNIDGEIYYVVDLVKERVTREELDGNITEIQSKLASKKIKYSETYITY